MEQNNRLNSIKSSESKYFHKFPLPPLWNNYIYHKVNWYYQLANGKEFQSWCFEL